MKISATLPSPVTRSHFHMSSYVATSFPWPFFVHCTDAQCDRGNTRTPTRAAISILVVFGSLITRHPMHRGAAHSILHRKFRLIHCFALSLSLSRFLPRFYSLSTTLKEIKGARHGCKVVLVIGQGGGDKDGRLGEVNNMSVVSMASVRLTGPRRRIFC